MSRPVDPGGDWDPDTYAQQIRRDIAGYDELQERLVVATAGVRARRILELGTGTGETARRVLAAHPGARLIGIDETPAMLARARALLDPERVRLVRGRLQDPLPAGPFELVVSALAVHHLDGPGKADLFARAAAALAPGGRLVLADVVAPDDPADAEVPLEPGHDFPSTVADQLAWLGAAGLDAHVAWQRRDLAVLSATRPASARPSTPSPRTPARSGC